MKKIVSFFVLLLFVSVLTQAQTLEQINKNAEIADSLNEMLLNFFDKDQRIEFFPDYYGGSYIDDKGNLVVLVTKDSDINKSDIAQIIKNENFTVLTVNYSYKKISSVMDSIDAFISNYSIPNNHIVLQYFTGAYIDVMQNCVVMQFSILMPELIYSFKKNVTDSSVVKFRKNENTFFN
ncbi:MAG: hypothetical protein PHY69_04085 [Dysgonamonadaceae bacterium]|nr:hypothetical protein [Dysgonamonadaceae bacterium]MDD3309125.1 hypothetical protein [Dysgonamonadaceae bacterium]MDD3900662.1 hypothetical protein [Dysgonamonadaceae bacterium]MDD4397938.1 hypothetical protein [Dysgonamonadaceae bacterium]